MNNINKIIIAVVLCVFMICVASVSIVSIVTSNEKETTTTTVASPSGEGSTDAPSFSGQTQGTSQTTSSPAQQSSTTTTYPSTALPSTSAPTSSANGEAYTVTGNLATDILGKWTDSAGMSGYEFLEGGRVNMTYVDLAGFGVPFNGTASGLYTLEGDTLTVKFSIYTATIKKVYRISISHNELSMLDLEEYETSTYARAS